MCCVSEVMNGFHSEDRYLKNFYFRVESWISCSKKRNDDFDFMFPILKTVEIKNNKEKNDILHFTQKIFLKINHDVRLSIKLTLHICEQNLLFYLDPTTHMKIICSYFNCFRKSLDERNTEGSVTTNIFKQIPRRTFQQDDKVVIHIFSVVLGKLST